MWPFHETWNQPQKILRQLQKKSIKCNFPLQSAGDNYTLLSGTKTIRGIEGSRLWVLVDGLVPCSHYMVQVNASNSRGSVLSDPVSVEMPPGGESVRSLVGFLVLNRRTKNRVASELCLLELKGSAVVLHVQDIFFSENSLLINGSCLFVCLFVLCVYLYTQISQMSIS